MSENTSSSRIIYFDYLRVAATFLVMLLHVASACWSGTDVNSRTWALLNGYKSITDHGVLLFVLISGALFLDRETSLKKLYLKHVLRMVCAYIFWAFIYSITVNYYYGPVVVIRGIFFSHYHLWFLPMIIGLYICVPLLQQIAKSEFGIKYFLILSFIFSFLIPQIRYCAVTFLGMQDSSLFYQLISRYTEMNLHMVIGYPFYFILGYYLHRKEIGRKLRILIYAGGLVGVFLSFQLSLQESRMQQAALDTFHSNFTVSVLLKVIATFVLFKYAFRREQEPERQNRKVHRVFFDLAKYSFGAYLVHALLLEGLQYFFNINVLSFNPIFSAVILTSGVFIVAFLVSFVLNKIPFLNRYIV